MYLGFSFFATWLYLFTGGKQLSVILFINIIIKGLFIYFVQNDIFHWDIDYFRMEDTKHYLIGKNLPILKNL